LFFLSSTIKLILNLKNKDGLFSNFIKLFLAQSDSNKENARAHREETQVIFEDELLDSTSNLNGSVEFHLSYVDFVLKEINAEILPGEKIGIVGK
jgi:hypothetical protein